MKRIICEIEEPSFELFLIELNGYGFEIVGRDKNRIKFAIYSEDKDLQSTKEMVECVFKDIGTGNVLDIEDIEEENWEFAWQENFKPVVVSKFIVIPEWEIYRGNKYIPIKIHIGKAFGTGLHSTTQLMLELLPEVIKREYTVLDVGTGTGILAIASKKLGAKRVIAIDIEDAAIEECELNSWENEVDIECIKSSIENINGKFDVIVANLQLDIFEKYMKDIKRRFKKYFVASGIFNGEIENFKKLLKENNLKIIKQIEKRDNHIKEEKWYGFIIQHK